MFKDKLKMNLQMFAADDGGGSGGENPKDDPKPPADDQQGDDSGDKKPDDEPTVTVAEMQRRLAKAEEKAKEEAQKALDEAERLAKMNAEEKEQYEREQLEKELEEYKQRDQFYSLSKEASKMLSEHEIQADDEVLQLVVKGDAEGTQKAVNAFVEIINAKVEQGVQKALSGRTPKANVNASQAVTQEDFNKMGYSERVALKQKDEKLYNKLKGE